MFCISNFQIFDANPYKDFILSIIGIASALGLPLVILIIIRTLAGTISLDEGKKPLFQLITPSWTHWMQVIIKWWRLINCSGESDPALAPALDTSQLHPALVPGPFPECLLVLAVILAPNIASCSLMSSKTSINFKAMPLLCLPLPKIF